MIACWRNCPGRCVSVTAGVQGSTGILSSSTSPEPSFTHTGNNLADRREHLERGDVDLAKQRTVAWALNCADFTYFHSGSERAELDSPSLRPIALADCG
jgi:hypothetical protein